MEILNYIQKELTEYKRAMFNIKDDLIIMHADRINYEIRRETMPSFFIGTAPDELHIGSKYCTAIVVGDPIPSEMEYDTTFRDKNIKVIIPGQAAVMLIGANLNKYEIGYSSETDDYGFSYEFNARDIIAEY
jgi:hypothetical protein